MSDTSEPTELDLLVGSIFTARPEEDRELFEEEREWLSAIQDELRKDGIEVDLLSRPGVEVWEGGIESLLDLYQLRLAAAYLEQGKDVAGAFVEPSEQDEDIDPALVAILEDEQTTRFPHLIKHQAEGGYYLPVDFAEPIWLEGDDEEHEHDDDEEEHDDSDQYVSFGSSVGLQRELVELEGMLKGAGVSESHGAFRCLSVLRSAADQSVANDLPIILW